MKKTINILWEDNDEFSKRSAVEQLVNAFEDFAYGYDVEDEAFDYISQVLTELGIEFEILEDEDDDL